MKIIAIDVRTKFGPSVYLYDHDYRAGLKENKYKSAPITIGNNCVIGAGIVIRGEYPSDSVVAQKRNEMVLESFKR